MSLDLRDPYGFSPNGEPAHQTSNVHGLTYSSSIYTGFWYVSLHEGGLGMALCIPSILCVLALLWIFAGVLARRKLRAKEKENKKSLMHRTSVIHHTKSLTHDFVYGKVTKNPSHTALKSVIDSTLEVYEAKVKQRQDIINAEQSMSASKSSSRWLGKRASLIFAAKSPTDDKSTKGFAVKPSTDDKSTKEAIDDEWGKV